MTSIGAGCTAGMAAWPIAAWSIGSAALAVPAVSVPSETASASSVGRENLLVMMVIRSGLVGTVPMLHRAMRRLAVIHRSMIHGTVHHGIVIHFLGAGGLVLVLGGGVAKCMLSRHGGMRVLAMIARRKHARHLCNA